MFYPKMCKRCGGDVVVDIYPTSDRGGGYDIYCIQCSNRIFGPEIEELLRLYRKQLATKGKEKRYVG